MTIAAKSRRAPEVAGEPEKSEKPATQVIAARTVVAACAVIVGAWIAAGSIGLVGHALRHALVWVTVVAAIVSGWRSTASTPSTPSTPSRRSARFTLRGAAISLAGLVLAAWMLASTNPAVDVLGIALVGLVLAERGGGADRNALRCAALAAAMLALWRHLYGSIPSVMLSADAIGRGLGNVGGLLGGQALWIGATFGGIDFLIVMIALLAGALIVTASEGRAKLVTYSMLAIAAAHVIYLATLAALPPWVGHAPPIVTPAIGQGPIGQAPTLTWQQIGGYFIPWNLPVLAALLHTLVAAGILKHLVPMTSLTSSQAPRDELPPARRSGTSLPLAIGIAAAALLPLSDSLWLAHPNLERKKIVFYEKGFLNWLKPKHGEYGRLGGGMYGMLPPFLETLGARPLVSPELSETDVNGAALVVLLFPDERNPLAESQLARLERFVRGGGTLLVVGDHTQHDSKDPPVGDKPHNQFNVVLGRMTSMYIPFDSAMFQIGGWLQSYETIAHPTTLGLRDDRNQFGVVIGASVRPGWSGQPLIVGRWGFSDPGDVGSEAAMMGNRLYDPGEKLGDQILAAEQQVGRGRVVAFGDTSSFTNGINVGAHTFTSRLFAYLANGGGVARPIGRQLVALILAGVLLWALWRQRSIFGTAVILTTLAGAITLCTHVSYARAEALPDGRRALNVPFLVTPNNLAYIQASNLEAKSEEGWRPDGTAGLALTLMRNGYVTLQLPEITRERLDRAGLLISIAPHRPYTAVERAAIRSFIENGGNFILTAGYGDHEASAPLLSELGLWGGQRPGAGPQARPPEPMGHFKSPYVDTGQYMAFVRFHAAWAVGSDDPQARIIANGTGNVPVIIMRSIGRGKVMLVGDTGFAMNKNLEWEDGSLFDGMRENADFWRWLITVLTDQPMWLPHKPQIGPVAPAVPSASASPNSPAPANVQEAPR